MNYSSDDLKWLAKIAGYEYTKCHWYEDVITYHYVRSDDKALPVDKWCPFDDIAQAFECLEAFNKIRPDLSLIMARFAEGDGWSLQIGDDYEEDLQGVTGYITPAASICKSLLEMKGRGQGV